MTDESRRVLEVIRSGGNVRGWDLMSRTGLTDGETLRKAVMPLIKEDLLSVSGNVTSGEDILSAVFGIRPSSIPRAEFLLKQAM